MDAKTLIKVIDYAFGLGIIALPKSVYLYRRTIWAAFEGDYEGIEQALIQLRKRYDSNRSDASEPLELVKWKVGMQGSYEGAAYVLTMYLNLLREFNSHATSTPNSISKIIVKSKIRKSDKVVHR